MPGQSLGFQPLKSPMEMAGATPTVGELFAPAPGFKNPFR